MEELLESLLREYAPKDGEGAVASYIPELRKGNPKDCGICVITGDNKCYCIGDYDKKFTIQSVIKPILLLLALIDNGEAYVQSKVGVEATGKPFDAINMTEQTLLSEHINPMVNMGAIAICTLIHGDTYEERFRRLLALTRQLADNPEIDLDEAVYHSEKRSGNKNRALAYMLKTYGIIEDEVEDVLDCYFKACSIRVTAKDLARIALVLANRGKAPGSEQLLFPRKYARYVNAVLMTCGMYDGSGEFAVRVGIPAKSGVGGGIMAVVPTRMGIGIFSPALDKKGNSVAGIRILEGLSARLFLSIF